MFKNWSIKSILQLWVGVTLLAVSLMGLMVNQAKHVISETEVVFQQQLVPVKGAMRKLNLASLALSQQQNQYLETKSLEAFQAFGSRNQTGEMFQKNIKILMQTFENDKDAQDLVGDINQLYLQYTGIDDKLFGLKHYSLQLKTQFDANVFHFQETTNILFKNIDSMESQLVAIGPSPYLAITQQLRDWIYELSFVQFKSVLNNETITDDQRVHHNADVILQKVDLLIHKLNVALSTSVKYRNELENINNSIELINLLVVGNNQLHTLYEQLLDNRSQLNENYLLSLDIMSQLTTQLAVLIEYMDEYVQGNFTEGLAAVEQARLQALTITGLSIFGVLLSAILLFRRIHQPIVQLKESMHALSDGRFETRMSETPSQNEIALLAKDFNHFAETTQQLIADYSFAKTTLQQRQTQLTAVLNSVPEAILTLNQLGEIIEINPAGEEIIAEHLDNIVGKKLSELFINYDATIFDFSDLATITEKSGDFDAQRLDGGFVSFHYALSRVEKDRELEWVCILSDITQWKQTNHQLRQMTSELDAILENAMVGIAFIRDRKFIRVNQKFEQLTGYGRDELLEKSTRCLFPSDKAYEKFGERIYHNLVSGEDVETQIEMKHKNSTLFWAALAGKSIDTRNIEQGSIWLIEDITKQRENERRLVRLASMDDLTGLANRATFNDRLEHALHKAERNSNHLAVCFLDLDHFKHINDSLGHKAGDNLLKQVAIRIKDCLRDGDTVARLGGDEFTLILEDIRSVKYVGNVIEKIIQVVSQPYQIDSTEVNVSPSIGISLYPSDGRDLNMLIRNADAAMYHAKKLGRNNAQFYSSEMNALAMQRLAMESALRRAVEQQEFFLHFQPQIDLQTGKIVGAEVLIRWESEQWGMVSPGEFVPILEDTGLIVEVGYWVLQHACETYLEMQENLSKDFKLAVNLSGRQFKGGNLSRTVQQILTKTGMSVANLELEITETVLMDDPELATTTLSELSEMGINLAIDDFGTGYSSLSYLKQFPINLLKIDGSFVRDMTTDNDDAAIVKAILALSDSLGLEVVAEGVETMTQLEYLRECDCHIAQGYLFSRPIDKTAFIELLKQDKPLFNIVEQQSLPF